MLCAGGWLANSTAADIIPEFDVNKYGALGDGKTLDTQAIQSAIDAAAQAGGGVVRLDHGKYLSGSLQLKSHVDLRIETGATLLGSTLLSDYLNGRDGYALLLADGQAGITITGAGTIDGQGRLLAQDVVRRVMSGEIKDPMISNRPNENQRPKLIMFSNCRHVQVSGVTLKNSACWVQDYDQCYDLVIKDIHVDSTAYWNNDGIDISDCRHVQVSGCDVNADDDGICLKSETGKSGCDDVEVWNCKIRSSASAVKFGTASAGGFRNVHVHDLHVYNTYRSSVALECVDGGLLENVIIENIEAKNTGNAVFIRLGCRKPQNFCGLSHVTIRNIQVEVPAGAPDAGYDFAGPSERLAHNIYPSCIVGLPGFPISNVLFENISITCAGGGTPQHAQASFDKIEERPSAYPECSMFGELPAWGFYVRHAEGIEFRNCQLTLKKPDYRPAMIFDDVSKLTIDGLKIGPFSGKPVILLNKVINYSLKGIRYPSNIPETSKIQIQSSTKSTAP